MQHGGRIRWPRTLLCLLLAGCSGLSENEAWNTFWFGTRRVQTADEPRYRAEYQSRRSETAFRWLLANRLQPGMSYAEVCRVLGEDGQQEHNTTWLKGKGGLYRVDDTVYAFGPDAGGHSVYLVFRDDRLVNFDPEEFREQFPSRRTVEE